MLLAIVMISAKVNKLGSSVDETGWEERSVVRSVEADDIYPFSYHLAYRHHDRGVTILLYVVFGPSN